jgi:4-hydroxyphenylpyruvate dioxygenase
MGRSSSAQLQGCAAPAQERCSTASEINFIVNAEPDFRARFARQHGPSIGAIAFRVADAKAAYERAVSLGSGCATARRASSTSPPSRASATRSSIHHRWRVRRQEAGRDRQHRFYDVDFEPLKRVDCGFAQPAGPRPCLIDHLTHNVHRGRMDEWSSYYERLFSFREIRYFDLEGQVTGIKSRAMTSPCGKIRIPINEEGQEKAGQIQEYLDRYHGEGVQHIAMGSADLYRTVDALSAAGVKLLATPDTYYERVDARIPGHGRPLAELRRRNI